MAPALRTARQRLERDALGPAAQQALSELMVSYLERTDRPTEREQRAIATAFDGLWNPRRQPVPEPPGHVRDTIRDQFHRLYYHVSMRTWKDTWYRGIATYKCPTDMWVYQELVDQLCPGLVVETGTFRGGSALFLADRLEIAGHGEVVTVDVDVQPDRPSHPRLTYLEGSSVDPSIVEQIRSRIGEGEHVLVILDSDHSQAHVAAELRAYADMVTPGSYLIVEDTNVNGHPAAPDHGPGPWEAVADFLAEDDRFEVDERAERYFLTQNPSGFLRRRGGDG
ncbi:CmcI family methyltransferase [Nocardioides sp. C4-1]|uniref:CmcI family methyltransferase n=1 Tax=Nocardioides sp. C4-1 TaxID=3151851 RepID=UPI0032655068